MDADALIASLTISPDDVRRPFDTTNTSPLIVEFTAEYAGRVVAATAIYRLFVADDVLTTRVRERSLSGVFFQPASIDPTPARDRYSADPLAHWPGRHRSRPCWRVEALLRSRFVLRFRRVAGAARRDSARIFCRRLSVADRAARRSAGRSRCGRRFARWRAGAHTGLPPAVRAMRGRVLSEQCGLERAVRDRPADLPAWTTGGRSIPFFPLLTPALSTVRDRVFRESPVSLTPLFDAALDGPVPADVIIPVEQTNGPILLVSGDDDRMWPAARMGRQIMDRLAAHEHPFASRHVHYPDAGHLMRPPGVPTRVLDGKFRLGGTPEGQAAANRAAWLETVAFLRERLAPSLPFNRPTSMESSPCR